MSGEDKIYFNDLYAEYFPLLTENQRSAFEMYFRLDLSLGEIAEIKGVSRQSVADSVNGVKKQLAHLEESLGNVRKKKAVYQLIEALPDSQQAIKESVKQILGE